MKKTPIDYNKISLAVDHYGRCGYKYLDAPWFVSPASIEVTSPPGCRSFETFAGCLVASGEQSFIEIRDKLVPGYTYQCVTPCFRDEKVQDETHRQYFLKVELIIVLVEPKDAEEWTHKVVADALGFFQKFGDAKVMDTGIGRDIFLGGLEVGSYGYRSHGDFHWVYGTGCAEPRLSQAERENVTANSALERRTAELVWDILAEECGARPFRDEFMSTAVRGFSEFRFQGLLGFGGKVYNNPLRVSCYPEDLTPGRHDRIQRANNRLKKL